MNKRWILKEQPDPNLVQKLSEEINVNDALAALLIQRNTTNYQEAKQFFRPDLDYLHDPFLMKDMDRAVERLNRALENNEKILIYGDYDVDGTTSVALVYGFLRSIHKNLDFYIPDRYAEGYGISQKAIDWASEHQFNLIISLDCGVKAVSLVHQAKQKGIDFIICDHHRPGEKLPEAIVLDSKRDDCEYPYKELSGCGVGFKLLQALSIFKGYDTNILFSYLDLVAISIASDIVPITGENRILTFHGLKQLNEKPRPGVKALIEVSALKNNITVTEIVFGLGPRINAAGRIDHAKASVNLLLCENEADAKKFAAGVNDTNNLRRNYDLDITQQAIDLIEADLAGKTAKSTVLFKNDWHKGVIGIVASRCIEKFYRPTIILTESNQKITGSARSVPGFDVYEAISECSDLLEQFGGHMYAAGLTLKKDKVEAFKLKFEEVVSRKITEDQLIPQIIINLNIPLDKITYKFFNVLRQMAPFGPENMHPVFMTENVRIVGRPRIFKNQHLKFYVKQENSSTQFDAIGFDLAEYYDMISCGMLFSMAYTIEENDYMNRKSLQLCIKDIKFD